VRERVLDRQHVAGGELSRGALQVRAALTVDQAHADPDLVTHALHASHHQRADSQGAGNAVSRDGGSAIGRDAPGRDHVQGANLGQLADQLFGEPARQVAQRVSPSHLLEVQDREPA
jgi:hypothetical protein